MEIDTTISLDLIFFLLVGAVAVRWLEKRMDNWFSESQEPPDAEKRKPDKAALRQEFKADNAELRTELKAGIAELRQALRRVEAKVDDGNQRLARLEGIILAREDMVDTIVESSQ